jgi:hypothetical protein
VSISTKGTKSEKIIFYIESFEHSKNWGETAKFEFLRARF